VQLPSVRSIFARFKPLKRRTLRLYQRKLHLTTWRRTAAAFGLLIILAAGPGLYFYLHNPNRAQAAWFDTNWSFRQKIPLTNTGSAQTNFQVLVTIDTATLITAGKLQSSCQDVRFTSITGKALSYWIEPTTCNTATTKVWVKVDSIATASSGTATDIYFYYGNAGASTASDTNKTFIADQAAAAVAWPLDDTTTTQSYSRVTNPAVATGRNIVVNGTFDTDTIWSRDTNWTIAGGVASANAATVSQNIRQTIPLVIGKSYTVTYTISNYSSGSIKVYVGNGTNLTTRSANGTYTETVTNAGNSVLYLIPVTTFTGDIDNVIVQQVNIPDSSTFPGAEILVDGDAEAVGTAAWTSNGTLSKQTTSPHGGTQLLRIAYNATSSYFAYQNVATIGKTYRVTGWARSDGTNAPRLQQGSGGSNNIWIGTTSTSWQEIDAVYIADSVNSPLFRALSATSGYIEFDDLSIKEIDPLVGLPTNGVTLGTAVGAGGHLTTGYTFDGTNDNVNIYSSDLNSVFSPDEGSAVVWAKVSGAGVWTDATSRRILRIGVASGSSNNDIRITKTTTTNQLQFNYAANSVASQVNDTSLGGSTGWFQAVITWSKSKDQVKAYINGVQVGSTQTGLGTWSGNLASTAVAIGASDSSGTSGWSGMINDVRLYTRVLSETEIAAQYNASSDIQAYTTNNYAGRELLRKYSDAVAVGAAATEEVGSAPVPYWKFDDGTGTTAKDSSANSNNGTLGGTTLPTWQVEDQCVSAKCLYFDGATSKVTGSKIIKGIKTVGFWIRPNNIATQGILNLDGGTHKISTNASGVITATGFSSPTYYINGLATTTPTLTIGQWNYVEITTATGFDSTSSFTVGTDGTYYVGGYIDEVKFYAYDRSAAQVKVDFTGTANRLGSAFQQGLNPPGLVAGWALQDTTTTQSYSAVTNPGVARGRNMIVNSTFSDATAWTTPTGWSISGGTAVAAAAAASSNLNQASVQMVTGKMYQVTFTISNYSAGTIRPLLGSGGGGVGTTRSANGTYTEIIIAGTTASTFFLQVQTTFTGNIDDVIVTQLSIPASTATQPTQLLLDGDAEASGTSAFTTNNSAVLSKQTGTPHGGSQVLRVARGAVSQPYASQTILTVGNVYRIHGYARTDGSGGPTVVVRQNSMNSTIFLGTTSAQWQPFDATFVATATDLDLGMINGSNGQYVEFDDVVVSPDTYIRPGELLIDGNMEASGTADWTLGSATGTLTKDTGAPHGGTQNLRVARVSTNNPHATQSVLVAGKTYRITGWAKTDGSSTAAVYVGSNGAANVVASTASWTFFDLTKIATNGVAVVQAITSTGTQYAEFDDISITEVSPLVGLPTNGVTLGSAANGHLANAYTFDGTNDGVNIYSSDLSSVFNATEGSVVAWAKVSGSGVWSDSTLRRMLYLSADGNNRIIFQKDNAANSLLVYTIFGGTVKQTSISTSTTSWMMISVTWSKKDDQVKAYFNGVQTGNTLTGLGTWVGNLSSTNTMIGATGSVVTDPWSGAINDVKLFNRALSPAEISTMYGAAPGPVAYWKLDEHTGTSAFDSSGNANTGTLTNTPTWVPGKYGSSLKFVNASSQYVQLSSANLASTLTSTGYYTMEGWIKLNALPGSEAQPIVWSNSGTDRNGIYIKSDGVISGAFYNGSYTGAGSSTITTDTWYHVAYVNAGGTVSFYLNGVLATGAGSPSLPSSEKRIGNGFDGIVDDVRIYNYARTPQQIQDDMRGSSAGNTGVVSSVGGSANSTKPASTLGYWKFDEGQGTTANNAGSVGSVLNGTLTSMAAPATSTSGWNNAGKTNKALIFDGSDDYVDAGTSTVAEPTTLSISGWIFVNNTGVSTILDKTRGASSGSAYLFDYGGRVNVNAQKLEFAMYNGSTWTTAYSTNTLAFNAWHHVAVTYDLANIKIYVNGKLDSTTAATTAIAYNGTQNLFIGKYRSVNDSFFKGKIDELKLFNFPLTADQVRADYNQGLALNSGVGATTEAAADLTSGAGNAPVAEWQFEERTGTSTKDTSGGNNTGTLTNGPTWTTGKYGSAVNFDGTDDYVAISAPSSVTRAGTYSLSAWVKIPDSSNTNAVVIENVVSTSDRNGISITGTTASFGYYNGSTWTSKSGTIPTSTWVHLEGVDSAGTVNFYINGVLQTGSSTPFFSSTSGARIGATSGGGGALKGAVDQIQIYNYARAADQVAYDYNRGAPIGWWKMDECQGTTINDGSGNGNTGTITIGASGTQSQAGTCNTSGTAWGNGASGKYNSSLNFDGTNDFVTITDTSNMYHLTGDLTLSSWVKLAPSQTNGTPILISKGTTNDWLYALFFISGVPQIKIYNQNTSSAYLSAAATSALSTNQWHLVTGTISGTTAKLYIDGNLVTTSTSTSGTRDTSSAGSLYLSSFYVSGNDLFLTGQMDDTRIYNYPLTAAQVRKLYNNGLSVFYGPSSGAP
jgi:hypothetical protein